MRKHYTCPYCCSHDIERDTKVLEHREDSEDRLEFFYIEVINRCHSCKKEGDFFGETDLHFDIAEKIAQIKKINHTCQRASTYKIKDFN